MTRAVTLCAVIVAAPVLVIELAGPARSTVHADENLFQTMGGDIIPLRQISDPYPVFNGIAIDTANNLVAMTDVNRKSLMSYARSASSKSGEITLPDGIRSSDPLRMWALSRALLHRNRQRRKSSPSITTLKTP